MKTRSTLLLVFMIAVPAAAMFSHRIPSDVRRMLREQVGRLTAVSSRAKPSSSHAGGAAASVSASAAPGATTVPAASAATTPVVVPGAAVAPPAAVAPQPAMATIAAEDVVDRLTTLGAIGFECRPLAGGGGAHVASCSVPLDGSGQLLRVFHATAGDARSAVNSLLEDVESWRHREGVRRAAAEPVGAGTRSLRF